jgi:hypothetical protein
MEPINSRFLPVEQWDVTYEIVEGTNFLKNKIVKRLLISQKPQKLAIFQIEEND